MTGSGMQVSTATIWIAVAGTIGSIITGSLSLWGVFAQLHQKDRLADRKEREAYIASIEKDRDQFRRLWEASQDDLKRMHTRYDQAIARADDLEDRLRRRGSGD